MADVVFPDPPFGFAKVITYMDASKPTLTIKSTLTTTATLELFITLTLEIFPASAGGGPMLAKYASICYIA
jgi:hypothetical protein